MVAATYFLHIFCHYILLQVACPIRKINVKAGFMWKGIPIGIGGSYEVMGTKFDCTFWPFSKCDQNRITLCHEIRK